MKAIIKEVLDRQDRMGWGATKRYLVRENVEFALNKLKQQHQKELSKTNIDWQNSVMYWNAKCKKLKRTIKSLNKDWNEEVNKKVKLQKELKDLQDIYNLAMGEISKLREENQKLKTKILGLEGENKDLTNHNNQLLIQISEIKKELKDLEGRTNYEVFIKVEDKLNEIVKWSLLKNRKPACINWTSSPERNIARIIENLQFKLKENK